jgi:hypothetical protein
VRIRRHGPVRRARRLPSQEQLGRLSESIDRADEHAKQVAAIGDSPALAQIAEMNRAVNRDKAFRVRFTPLV